MGKPSKKVKYSATYCWIRWTNLYPVPGPGPSCPGPGRKRRRSLAGGLVWVLLGLVWLGSPFIVRLSECSTDAIKSHNDNHPIAQMSNERAYQLNVVQSDDKLTLNKRKLKPHQVEQHNSLANQHKHHHHLHHPVPLMDSTDRQQAIEKPSNKACPNCAVGSNEAETQTRSNMARKRVQSSKSSFGITSTPYKIMSTDSLRLEAIKQQILSKLGLKSKPNITHEFSKQTILNTLSRADDMNLQNDEIDPNTRNYYNYFKSIDRHLIDSNSINTNYDNIHNHYDYVTSKNHITNNMNTTYRDSTFTNNHIIQDNDRISNIDNNDSHYNKNLMDSKSNSRSINNNQINTNYNTKHHITQKHHTNYHPSKSKNHKYSQPDKYKSSTTNMPMDLNSNSNHRNSISNDNINNNHKVKVHRNRTTINEQKNFYKINNFSDISEHSDNNLLFVNEDDSYHIDGQLLQRHDFHQQPEQMNQPPDNNDAEPDDYFGRTREVITFAEQGKQLHLFFLINFIPH